MSSAEGTLLSAPEPVAAGGTAPDTAAPRRGRLFRKYALLFVALVGATLLVTSGFDFWFSYQESKAALVRIEHEKALAAAQRIQEFVGEIEHQIGWTTHAQWEAGPLDQRKQDYFRLMRQVPAITELSQLDREGREKLKVSRLSMDVVPQPGAEADFSQSPAFREAKAHRVWFSPVYFRKQSEPYMTLAVARDGRNSGVTVAEINLKLIWDVITALKTGQGGYAYVVDGSGRLIAHPDISLVLRDTDLSRLPQVAAALTAGEGPRDGADTVAIAQSLGGQAVLTAHALIAPLGWRVFIDVPVREAFAPLYGMALRTAALLAAGLIAATLIALVLARRMTGPIRAIAAGAERIRAGELDRRIDIRTGDELEALAGRFNHMAADLQKSYAELEGKVEERTAELSEALEQQTATAEVLQVINSSPGDLVPVFNAMLDKVMHLCDAAFGTLWTYGGDRFRPVAYRGVPERYAEYLRHEVPEAGPGTGRARLLAGEGLVQIADLADEEPYRNGEPHRRALVDLGGARTALLVPLRKETAVIGFIMIYRQEVRPFSDKQIALLQNFAAQAVIAIENTRLITETREALDQQTATAEVLGVINSSPGDLAPVFDAMLEKAMDLCGAAFGFLTTYDGSRFTPAAMRGVPRPLIDYFADGMDQPQAGEAHARILEGEDVVHNLDQMDEEAYRAGSPLQRAVVDLGGARSALVIALRKDGGVLGALTIYRKEVRAFSDKEVALMRNFAAQAVIAIENARLITETREALDQQTATAEVLQVINSSPGDLTPVFNNMLEKAMRLCRAEFGEFFIAEDEQLRAVAVRGVPPAFAEFRLRNHTPPVPGSITARILSGEPAIHVADVKDDDLYRRADPHRRALVDLGGARTFLSVTLIKDRAVLGSIN